jgi:hypothetical protein
MALKDYIIDLRTSFLTPSPAHVGPSLNADQKIQILKVYSETFNLSKAIKAALTTRFIVKTHLKEDKAFKEAFDDITEEILDEVEESIYKQSKKSPIAAMQLLKAKRGGTWGPKKPEQPVDQTSNKLKALLNDPD